MKRWKPEIKYNESDKDKDCVIYIEDKEGYFVRYDDAQKEKEWLEKLVEEAYKIGHHYGYSAEHFDDWNKDWERSGIKYILEEK